MARLNLGAKAPRCPLTCGDWMTKEFRPLKGFFVYVCHADKIAIRVDDPFVGRWEQAYHKSTDGQGIPCPRPSCDGKMRYFATSTGYMKAVCAKAKCGAAITNGGTREEGTVEDVTPDNPGVVQ